MWDRRIIAVAIAALGVAATVSSPVHAQSNDTREARAEVQLAVPRNADGAIDAARLRAQIRDLFNRGVREVRIRDEGLTAAQHQQVADAAHQVAAELGVERVRIRDEDNRLRIELRNEREARELRREDRREDRVEHEERHERLERPEREERVERPERPEERSERH